jgi:hypothetical protein
LFRQIVVAEGFDGGIRWRQKLRQAGRCAWMRIGFTRNRNFACVRVADKSGAPIAAVVTSARKWLNLLENR